VSTEEDSRVRYIYQVGSGSPASPRNHGIREARGEWVTFLDSDDTWHRCKLQKLRSALDAQHSDFVAHQQELLNAEGEIIGCMGPRQEYLTYERLLLTENTIATSSVAIRKQFLSTHNLFFNESERFAAVEDYDLWLRILAAGGRPAAVDQVLGTNREVEDHMGLPSLFFQNLHHLYKEHAWVVQTFTGRHKKLEKRLFAGIALRMTMIDARQKKWLRAGTRLGRAAWLCPPEILRYAALRFHQRRNPVSEHLIEPE